MTMRHRRQANLLTIFMGLCMLWATPSFANPDVDEFERTRQEILEHVGERELSVDEVTQWIDFAEEVKSKAKKDLSVWNRFDRAVRNPWVFFGLIAQATFMMRFVLQIIASERKKKSYVPIGFWYLSIIGGSMLFVYALHLRDPVFVLGQGLGIFIYTRNLMLIYRRRNEARLSTDERIKRNAIKSGGVPQDEGHDS
jgi:lipid-A-disaccharide synthase-like uncharacterized protein